VSEASKIILPGATIGILGTVEVHGKTCHDENAVFPLRSQGTARVDKDGSRQCRCWQRQLLL
jgi:hypothetical protein